LRRISGGGELKSTTLNAWLQLVHDDIESCAGERGRHSDSLLLETSLQQNPAAKLLGYFANLAEEKEGSCAGFATMETAKASPNLRALQEIKPEWIRKWIGGWINDSPVAGT